MKKYSIFYKENYKYYPVYKSNTGKYWLGGLRLEWLLFKTQAEANREAKLVRKQKSLFFNDGVIEVHLARPQVW